MFWESVAALTPMVCVALLFWFVMRAVLNADRRERIELARFEAEQQRAENVNAAADAPGATDS